MNTAQQRMVRSIVCVVAAFVGLLVVVIAVASHVVIGAVNGTVPIIQNLLLIAIALLGMVIWTLGSAMLKSGYSRAFWQLLGYDLSAEDKDAEIVQNEGETA